MTKNFNILIRSLLENYPQIPNPHQMIAQDKQIQDLLRKWIPLVQKLTDFFKKNKNNRMSSLFGNIEQSLKTSNFFVSPSKQSSRAVFTQYTDSLFRDLKNPEYIKQYVGDIDQNTMIVINQCIQLYEAMKRIPLR